MQFFRILQIPFDKWGDCLPCAILCLQNRITHSETLAKGTMYFLLVAEFHDFTILEKKSRNLGPTLS